MKKIEIAQHGNHGRRRRWLLASLAAEAAAWGKRDFGGNGSTLGSVAAKREQRQKRGIGGGSVALVDATAAAAARQAARQAV